MTRPASRGALLALLAGIAVSLAPAAARADFPQPPQGVVQTGSYESLDFHIHTLREVKLYRAFNRVWHQQYDFSCGSAALATLLTFQYNTPIDETTVFREMYAVGDQAQIRAKGFSLLDMKRFLEARGYTADGVSSPLDTLAQVRIPAIALITDRGYRHFVVVKGADKERVLLGDPALGRRFMTRREFEEARVGNIFFVIRSHRNLAQFNSPLDWNGGLHVPLRRALEIDSRSLALEILDIPNESRF
ncbi:MAG: C39 family peptidase [Gammaproteobacteria bacterium]|nr:C39 family peptidase [Gammaproteobacteria bacterium]MBV8496971.1 C39 family peptidase [Gammaproteobacteria bacterium]